MEQTPQKIGKGMIIAAWITALALLTWFFSGVLEHRENPNQNPLSNSSGAGMEVVLQRNHWGHYKAGGYINAVPVVFFLDTGATAVSVPESTARRIGLKRGAPMQVSTANGTVTVYAVRLDSVKLGGIELRDVGASINPHMEGEEVLLGMTFLKHLEFSQRGGELLLRQ